MNPVELEVARHALAGIAEQMGVALQRSAYSPNIKERVDCSAAVFDPDGQMIAQAEHIPVHLGSMPASVAAAIDAFGGALDAGTHILLNDPYAGGTHLPDLTLVTAVGDDAGRLLGYVANRAHHADVGGAAPGSMPSSATDIAAEGLRIPPTVVGRGANLRDDVLEMVAANSRTPRERRGDLRAQFAANHVGATRLRELAASSGPDRLRQAMTEVCDYSDRRVRAAVTAMPDGRWTFADQLEIDHPATIRCAVSVNGDTVSVDFDGTDPQVPLNVNAVLAVTVSSTWFVFRMLTDPAAPPNAGAYRACTVTAPPATLVNAQHPAPVAAGNVETSQRIVDVLLGAFAQALPDRVPAASQGTMNNLLIGAGGTGEPGFSYYETIAGGEGGTPGRPGMSGVHTGMTNTLNTPAEAMELAYPLRVWRAELRPGSGGDGRHPGGDGVVREIETLAAATVTLQTERRATSPWGLRGGGDGMPGRNVRIGLGGAESVLGAKGTWTLQAGERIRVETPGGGGWGDQPRSSTSRNS